jgi:O-acetyl-ADP-ribose deacetylase
MSHSNRIEAALADISSLAVDAVVNAANNSLRGGGGVDGAIHRAAGPELLAACWELGGCETGAARITRGYRLPAKYVIHAVGPVWNGGDAGEAALLASCYLESLSLADEYRLKSIAFPAISCGVYGYPLVEATRIAVATTTEYLQRNQQIESVLFACFNDETLHAYQRTLASCDGS